MNWLKLKIALFLVIAGLVFLFISFLLEISFKFGLIFFCAAALVVLYAIFEKMFLAKKE